MSQISSRVIGFVVALSALLCVALTMPVALRGGHPDPDTGRALHTFVTSAGAAASAVVPPSFAHTAGYSPVLDHDRLGDPLGSCSSPVPLPHEFDGACREHDYGYDLLRHADRVGGTLPGSARTTLDRRFYGELLASCSDRPGQLARGTCVAASGLAAVFVQANTLRQGRSVPDQEDSRSLGAGAAAVLAALGLGVLARRRWRGRTPASVPTTLALDLGSTFALFPSFVPRGAIVQGLVLAAYVAIVRTVASRALRGDRWSTPRARWLTLAGAGLLMPVVLLWSIGSLDAQRLAIGMPATDLRYWATVGLLAGGLLGLPALVRAAWRRRARGWQPTVALASAAAVLAPIAPVHGEDFGTKSDRPLLAASPYGAVRVFADDHTGTTMRQRAEVAVQRLDAAGGFTKSRIVIAVPTGSGWVDPAAVDGLERRFDGDVATVAVQYASTPSWYALLFHREDAERSATELFAAVQRRLATKPVNDRPVVHLYGESLGALAGQEVLRSNAGRAGVCSALWVGSPGGSRVGLPTEGIVANASDPVVHAQPELVIHSPGDRPWLPVVSYLNGAADLIGSLSVPAGSGHRYGPEQADALPVCGPTPTVRVGDPVGPIDL